MTSINIVVYFINRPLGCWKRERIHVWHGYDSQRYVPFSINLMPKISKQLLFERKKLTFLVVER